MSIPIRRENGIDDPLSCLPHCAGYPVPVRELCPIGPPTAARCIDLAARLTAAVNVDTPAPTTNPAEGDIACESTGVVVLDLPPNKPLAIASDAVLGRPRERSAEANTAFENMRGRWLLDPDPMPLPMRSGKLSFVFGLAAIVVGGALLVVLNEVPEATGVAAVVSPPSEDRSESPSVQAARLVVQSQRGFADDPVPLGISLVDASGEESLALIGLVTGSRLSVGTPLGSNGWQLSARTIGNAFIHAPKDFVGVMDVLIDLRSASNQPMDIQVARFEWIRKQ